MGNFYFWFDSKCPLINFCEHTKLIEGCAYRPYPAYEVGVWHVVWHSGGNQPVKFKGFY
jgi:hypothetical protein